MSFFFYEREHPSLPEIVVKEVPMNDFVEVAIPNSDLRTYLIHTVGRIGCDAALLHATAPDKTEHVVVTHYDRDNFGTHLGLIIQKLYEHPKDQRFANLTTAFGENDSGRRLLEQFLTRYAHGYPDVVPLTDLNQDHARELAEATNLFKYQLSFVRGLGGDPDIHEVKVEGSDYRRRF